MPIRSVATPRDAERSVGEQLPDVLPSLEARALRLCRNTVEAQDLVQDTIVRALRFESSFEPGTNLRAWMHQILQSVFISRCRRSTRERRALDWLAWDPCAWVRKDAAPPLRGLTSPVAGALGALPEKFARVIELVDLHDHSYREAAEVLGVPVGTVMSRLFRGRRLLASALSEPQPVAQAA